MQTQGNGVGVREQRQHLSPLLGEALNLLCNPAHSRAPQILLGQHGHQGLCEQVRVFPVAHHLLQNGEKSMFGLCDHSNSKGRWESDTNSSTPSREVTSDPDILQSKEHFAFENT